MCYEKGAICMYKTVFFNTKRQLSEEDIKDFEKKYKIDMPNEIKKHYLYFNGGYPEKSLFISNDANYVVNYFCSIGCNEGLSVEKILFLLTDKNIFPQWLIPLADDESGNLFCYSVHPESKGKIYYYNHEFEYGDNPENHITYLANNIFDFINALDYYDEE